MTIYCVACGAECEGATSAVALAARESDVAVLRSLHVNDLALAEDYRKMVGTRIAALEKVVREARTILGHHDTFDLLATDVAAMEKALAALDEPEGE